MPESIGMHGRFGSGDVTLATAMPQAALDFDTAVRRIPPLPMVTSRALALVRDPGSRRSELAQVLALDEGMTALFLRMVNSAYYGLPRRITSLDETIGFLGYENTKAVLFAVSARQIFYIGAPSYMLDRNALWRHSIAVASGSVWVARRRSITPISEVYVAGLLHDIGKLVLDIMVGHEPHWESASDASEDLSWTEIERRTIGCDHAELGAHAVQAWRLPQRVAEAVRVHHTPSHATLDPIFSAAVHIANAASLMAGIGLGLDGLRYPLDEGAIAALQWGDADMDGLLEEMMRAVHEAEHTLHPSQR